MPGQRKVAMKKNQAGIGKILVGLAKADAEARVKREEEQRAARTAAKNAARALELPGLLAKLQAAA
jgi:hypothetical protein